MMFINKQVTESIIMKKNDYRYIAECIFVKNGVKQVWRYTSIYDEKTNDVIREYKRIC